MPISPPHLMASTYFSIVEWNPVAFCFCEAGRSLGMACSWLDSRRTRIAREVAQHGHRGYLSGPVHFMGGLAKGGQEAHQFISTLAGLQCDRGVLLAPYIVTIDDLRTTTSKHHLIIDASYYGDVLGDTWNAYAFGSFAPSRFQPFLIPSEPTTLGHRYAA